MRKNSQNSKSSRRQQSTASCYKQSHTKKNDTIFNVPNTNTSTVDMQVPMYLKALVIRLWDLNSAAITTQQQRIEVVISSFGIGEEDQHFNARRWATVVQPELTAYEKIYELTSGTKDTMKSVHDTSILLLQVVGGFEHPTIDIL